MLAENAKIYRKSLKILVKVHITIKEKEAATIGKTYKRRENCRILLTDYTKRAIIDYD